MTKKCFKCGFEKELNEFYKHSQMGDGHLNKCIDCAKKDVLKRTENLRKNPEWVKSERKRSREKYHRLNYRESQSKQRKEKRPWTESYVYKSLRRKFNIQYGENFFKDFELHHWNYNQIDSVFILDKSFHKRLHSKLTFDKKTLCYFYNEMLLDSKEKHFDAITNIINNLKIEIVLGSIEIK